MVRNFEIGSRQVGPGQPCFVIAEAGVNHNGSLNLALQLIDAAAAAGADAVKFQTFNARRLVTADAPMADYQQANTGAEESQFAMLERLEMPDDWHPKLRDHCEARGLIFLSTPFDEESADFLRRLGLSAFKVPSGELTNHPYIARLAAWGRPLIVSTGMGSLGEVEAAVRTIMTHGAPPFALLQCVSAYPAPVRDVNLRAMHTMRAAFQVPVGYSDHTEGTEIVLAAVALGASIVEKHLTLDRSLPGPDHKASVEPAAFGQMVKALRNIEAAIGDGRKRASAAEANTAAVARKSLVTACDIPAGTILAETHLSTRRPGTGLAPNWLPRLLGCRTRESLPKGTLVALSHLEIQPQVPHLE